MGVCVCMCLCYTEEIITVAGEHTGDVRKTKGGGGCESCYLQQRLEQCLLEVTVYVIAMQLLCNLA